MSKSLTLILLKFDFAKSLPLRLSDLRRIHHPGISETFDITSWESFRMSMPNPQGPQALENESHWFRFVSHLDLQFLKITKRILPPTQNLSRN